jgi:hypothetical protein
VFSVPDIEMGLLRSSTPSPADEDETHISAQISPLRHTEHGHNLHEVIGEVLELFSRTLRAHD